MDSAKKIFGDLIIDECKSPFLFQSVNTKKSFDTSLLRSLLEEKKCKLERIDKKNNAWMITNAEGKKVFWSHGFSRQGKSFDQDTVKVLFEPSDVGEIVLYCEIIGDEENGYSVWATSNMDDVKKDSRITSEKEFTVKFLGYKEELTLCLERDFIETSRAIAFAILNKLDGNGIVYENQ